MWLTCEYGDVTAWDARQPKPLVWRMTSNKFGGNADALYAISGDGRGGAGLEQTCSVVVGGQSRNAYQVDCRKWSVKSVWRTPMKHDIVGLVRGDGGVVAALGLDHEVAFHVMRGSSEREEEVDGGEDENDLGRLHHNHHNVFRSRARWLGAAVVDHKLIGMDVDGVWYAVEMPRS
jgi:hypothetical protein